MSAKGAARIKVWPDKPSHHQRRRYVRDRELTKRAVKRSERAAWQALAREGVTE